ncbi:MAG: sulfur carrier protein ThiS [Chthoniobacteraceae bacterium]
MKIWLNGDEKEVAAETIAALVDALGLPSPALLVEHNGLALRREEWVERGLQVGDRVEIIRIVAGG